MTVIPPLVWEQESGRIKTWTQSDEHSVSEIVAALRARIADLAHDLLGEPNRALSTRQQLRYGSKGSLAIEIDGPQRGDWFDHEQNVGGDGLKLICTQRGLANGAALDWARDWLGLPPWGGHRRADTCLGARSNGDASKAPGRSTADDDVRPAERLAPEADMAGKVDGIIGKCIDLTGTAGELYLNGRAINACPWPHSLRYRPNAHDRYGALVALATEADGTVAAVQQIYVTSDGRKAPLAIRKRTNKAREEWAKVSAVRLPGRSPLVLCEGVENALSVWQATGQETWACLGIANIGKAPVPVGEPVIIARDGDPPGSKADNQLARAAQALVQRGHVVAIATPPEGEDANDVLVEEGDEAVSALIATAEPITAEREKKQLFIGSDVEIAGRVREDLTALYGRVVNDEGTFWRFTGTHWEPIPDREMRIAVHAYDGASFNTPAGESSRVKLGKSRIDSVVNECGVLCAEPAFFTSPPVGINCASGFIHFKDGQPALEPHHREHRCRHVLPGRWSPSAISTPPPTSLLARLLRGSFCGDEDAATKIDVVAEIIGAAALGYATKLRQPRAIILKGETAENGKSQILDLARGLLPTSAICSVTAARMSDERHIVGLVGKHLNASDELSSATAIASDTFKAVITGEPVQGRDVYKTRVEFRPVAQHLFATNTLPSFAGGMDRGVQRRLLVVPFNRVIPAQERVEAIGRRIGEEEADLLLAWAVEGAGRLIRQRDFTMPPSSKRALSDWLFDADPVLAWLDECVRWFRSEATT